MSGELARTGKDNSRLSTRVSTRKGNVMSGKAHLSGACKRHKLREQLL